MDQPWRFALGAVSVGRPRRGRPLRGTPESPTAELALIVDDDLQRCGVGRATLERLVDVAALRGLEALVAVVLVANSAMLGLLRSTDLPLTSRLDFDTLVEHLRRELAWLFERMFAPTRASPLGAHMSPGDRAVVTPPDRAALRRGAAGRLPPGGVPAAGVLLAYGAFVGCGSAVRPRIAFGVAGACPHPGCSSTGGEVVLAGQDGGALPSIW